MKRILLSVIVVILGIMAFPVSATEISGAQYNTRILVTNNSTLSYTNVVVPLALSTTSMVDGGMVSATATDIVLQNDVGQDVAVQPGYNGNPWMLFTASISPLKQQWKFLYSKNVASDLVAYFPDTPGMYILDSPTMELSNYFTIHIPKIQFDFTKIGYVLFQKAGSYSANITGSSNVTFGIISGGVGILAVTANGVADIAHSMTIENDGFYLKIYIDGILKNYAALPEL